MLVALLLVFACGYGHAETPTEACLDYIDVSCLCQDGTSFGGDPDRACEFTADERAGQCMYAEEEDVEFLNCFNPRFAHSCDRAAAVLECG